MAGPLVKRRKEFGLDFETYCDLSLPDVGLENYVRHPSFCPILASIAIKGRKTQRFELALEGYERFVDAVWALLEQGYTIEAHNAGFERAVLRWLGFTNIDHRVQDSAVMSRLLGCGSKLEVASRQLGSVAKLDAGKYLMQLFSFGREGYTGPTPEFIAQHQEEWDLYGHYCDVDAEAGLEIVDTGIQILTSLGCAYVWERECAYELLTYQQNRAGWHVDEKTVNWMHNRSWANTEIAKAQFTHETGGTLNFRSTPQLRKFCADRGVKVTSLDKYHAPVVLENTMRELAEEKDPERRKQLQEVVTMLEIKIEIGGSSLTKLPVILANMTPEGRLHDQYVHVGAGQTFRTSGRNVQMQNLARLKVDDDGVPLKDVATISDYAEEWSNGDMAGQLRQVFTAEHEDGLLFVGDFSAVESRALAYVAGEEWKLEVYREGRDLYKELVVRYDNIPYEEVTKTLRPKGKYSELSCGYMASGKAVQEFMFRLGFVISLEEATEWVTSWRAACPNIVKLWHDLDALLKYVVSSKMPKAIEIGNGMTAVATPFTLPSVAEVHPGSTSICFQLFHPWDDEAIVTRFIHGVYLVTSNNKTGMAYYKATETLGEKGIWSNINETGTRKANVGKPKNAKKKIVLNTIFGGKLTGIAVQSLCRELFFKALAELSDRLENVANAQLVGQFHDEANVEWLPHVDVTDTWERNIEAEELQALMEEVMSHSELVGFPLDADIKSAYRYIK